MARIAGSSRYEGRNAYDSALAGVRVVDLTSVMAGPVATMMLADLGAEVIKIERPAGDMTRNAMGTPVNGGDNNAFLAVNRNKRSVVLDLKSAAGMASLHDLLVDADVLVENMRAGTMDRLGLSDAELAKRYPRLVTAHVRGFPSGVDGAERGGYDIIAQAESGLMSVTGEDPERPTKAGVPIADLTAGLHAVIGILSSLIRRASTETGGSVEVALFTSALSLAVWEATDFLTLGVRPQPIGNHHRMLAPYGCFRAADASLIIAANNEPTWRSLCSVLNRPDLADDPRFVTNGDRILHLPELIEELEAALGGGARDVWLERLEAAGVLVGAVRTIDEVLSNEHLLPAHMILETDHPVAERTRVMGNPIVIDGQHASIRLQPPLLGEHTDDYLDPSGAGPE